MDAVVMVAEPLVLPRDIMGLEQVFRQAKESRQAAAAVGAVSVA